MPLVYASPLIVALSLAVLARFRIRTRVLAGLLSILALSLLVVIVDDGRALNVLVSVVTYGSLFLLIVERPYAPGDRRLIVVWGKALTSIAVIVSLIGVAQLVGAGFPRLLPYRDFSPDVFVGPFGAGGHRLVPIITGPALFYVVVSMMHSRMRLFAGSLVLLVLVVGVVAPGSNAAMLVLLVAAGMLGASVAASRLALSAINGEFRFARYWPKGTSLVVALLISAGIAGAGGTLVVGGMPHFLDSISRLTTVSGNANTSPKVTVAFKTVIELPDDAPLQPIIGLGLGNYSSWSQMLLSGVYVERFLGGRGADWLPVSYRPEAWHYVLFHLSDEMRARYGRYYVDSIATQPWFSWQSLYAETGIVGLLVLASLFGALLPRLRIRRDDVIEERSLKLSLGFYFWFVVLMGFTDNFFEYPWLMAPFLLGLALMPRRERLQIDPSAPST